MLLREFIDVLVNDTNNVDIHMVNKQDETLNVRNYIKYKDYEISDIWCDRTNDSVKIIVSLCTED